MKKLLKIRFVKFEKALVAQQLEMTGKEHFTQSEHVILSAFGIDFADDAIWLSCSCNINIGVRRFYHNAERDEYLDKVVKWISDEQFTGYAGEPKIDGDVYTWEMEEQDDEG